MAGKELIDGRAYSDAFLKTIIEDIRHELRDKVMAVIQHQIDDVIDSAVAALKVRVDAQRDFMLDRVVINMIVDKAA